MMRSLARKTLTALRLVSTPGRFAELAIQNLRRGRVWINHGKPFIYQNPRGYSFVCIPTSRTSVHEYVIRRDYEKAELDICTRWVSEGDACLDVGANIGLFVAQIHRHLGSQGSLVAVEPGPQTAEYLRQAVKILNLSNTWVEQVCVSQAPGEVDFMISDTNRTGAGADVLQSLNVTAGLGAFCTIRVPATTLDALVEAHKLESRMALVKIDIEGAEPLAFLGAARLLQAERQPLWFFEVNKVALKSMNFAPLDALRHFPLERFELFCLQCSLVDLRDPANMLRPRRITDPAKFDWPWRSNVIAVPNQGPLADRRNRIAELL